MGYSRFSHCYSYGFIRCCCSRISKKHRAVDYALFVEGKPIGVVEAKKDDAGENITVVEGQSGRYANSKFKYVNVDYHIRFACLID